MRALLEAALAGPLDAGSATGWWPRPVATRWRCWSCRGVTPGELAGEFALPAAVPLSASIEEASGVTWETTCTW
jgi:hypothetical protein